MAVLSLNPENTAHNMTLLNNRSKVTDLLNAATPENAIQTYGQIANNNDYLDMTPQQEKYLDMLISQYNSQHDLLNQAGQLQQLGLSSGNVIQTGGNAAEMVRGNASARSQEIQAQKAGQMIGLAKSFIGLSGGLASAGLYGHVRNSINKAASAISSQAASSGLKVANMRQTLYDKYGITQDDIDRVKNTNIWY